MGLRILQTELHVTPLRTRMPFRYGIATMTEVPLAFVSVHAEIEGQRLVGTASDLLPPKWFTKVPDKPLDQEVAEMERVIRHAMGLAVGRDADNVFQLWRGLYEDQLAWAKAEGLPPLLANFGTSLVERALIEAACRALQHPFGSALRREQLGVELGAIHEALRGSTCEALLPPAPLAATHVRHTVGLGDPLTEADITAPLDDGLPQSLSASIRTYGLSHFKIKVTGQADADFPRLDELAGLLGKETPRGFAFSLDGNEQFRGWAAFREYWEALRARPGMEAFLGHLMFVEQPLHRDVALDAGQAGSLADWQGHPPCIIDESDATLESLPEALALGYAGTSHKNCKGIFKGVANACLLRQQEQGGVARLMSGEDLCTIGPVALLQDLAVMGMLGIGSVERNGHHYHAGLSQLPKEAQEQVLRHHPDLYRRSRAGWPTMRIEDGRVSLASVSAAPFGTGFELDVEPFERVAVFEA